ncbi:MAG: glycosyltransferase family 4 protein [Candidatus Woesebacteria bacterium]|jgi:glycosyltransferase involved in cell wall biosynthesis
MKILMLGWELPPYNTGGLGVACFELCKALSTRGVEIDFVVPYQDDHNQIDFMNVVPALSCAHGQLCRSGLENVYNTKLEPPKIGNISAHMSELRNLQSGYTKAVSKIVKKSNYDAIHAHDWLTFEAAACAKKLSQKPLIAHVHATEFDRAGGHSGNPLIHDIEYNTLMMADRVIAVSQSTKDIIASNYQIPSNKVEVVHNSIDAESFNPIDGDNVYVYLSKMKQYGYKVVVNVGRLAVQKGLTQLLMAAKLVIQKNSKILFLIAGSGEQYHELLQLSADLGISQNVIFTGQFVRGKKWRDAFAIGDVFVMPSVSEPFGIAALEAIGCGTPALISKQSGVGEVLKNVLKFDYWDTQKMADYILAATYYPSLHHELLTKSHAEFKNMSWRDVAQKIGGLYSKTTAKEVRV